jgi:hypothetical protein
MSRKSPASPPCPASPQSTTPLSFPFWANEEVAIPDMFDFVFTPIVTLGLIYLSANP